MRIRSGAEVYVLSLLRLLRLRTSICVDQIRDVSTKILSYMCRKLYNIKKVLISVQYRLNIVNKKGAKNIIDVVRRKSHMG